MVAMPNTDDKQRPLYVRLAWLFGIWAASIIALGVVTYTLKLIFTL
ncbi:MAG: DUF2474 domain-containing protein [Parvibaculum sp.]|nr:DUF2474 domain-containing protein [Parvibaculum sp.]